MRERVVAMALVMACGARTGLDVDDGLREATALDVGADAPADTSDANSSSPCPSTRVIVHQPWADDNADGIDQILVAGSDVYFHSEGVWHTSITGGAIDYVGGGDENWPQLSLFDVSATDVFWVDSIGTSSTSEVMSAARGGGLPNLVATIPFTDADSVILANGGLYAWDNGSDDPPGAVAFVATNGTVTVLSPLPANTQRMVISGPTLYVGATQGLFAWDGASSLTKLTSIKVADLALDGDSIVFTEGFDSGNEAPLSVWREPLIGGDPVPLVSDYSDLLGGIAVDNASVYFVDRGGSIVRITKESGVVTVIASAETGYQAEAVALDDRCVYFTATAVSGLSTVRENQVYISAK